MIETLADDAGRVRLRGDLTVDEVPAVYRKSRAWLQHGLPRSIDLSGVGATDSSAVALLLEWAEWAVQQQRRIEFLNPPEGLRTIAGLSQVGRLLDWETPS